MEEASCDGRYANLVIGGTKFLVRDTSLRRIPDTRLSKLTPNDPEYDEKIAAYVFGRNPVIFSYILAAYDTGILHLPHELCSHAVKDELDFWQVPSDLLPMCCLKRYRQTEDEMRMQARMMECLKIEGRGISGASDGLHFRIYRFLRHPRSSIGALIWYLLFSIMILISCGLNMLPTMPMFKVYRVVDPSEEATQEPDMVIGLSGYEIANLILMVIFIFEWIIRFVTSPDKRNFLMSFINVIDILSTILMVVVKIIYSFAYLPFLNHFTLIFYTLRTLRIPHFLSDWRRFDVIMMTIRTSLLEMLPILLLICSGIITSSACIYYSEADSYDSQFRSIPHAMWWSVITITTVGYGDMRPISGLGQAVGAIWAILGLLSIGLPIPILMKNYNQACVHADLKDSILERMEGPDRSRGRVLFKSHESEALVLSKSM